jgi:hypothetical protein
MKQATLYHHPHRPPIRFAQLVSSFILPSLLTLAALWLLLYGLPRLIDQ